MGQKVAEYDPVYSLYKLGITGLGLKGMRSMIRMIFEIMVNEAGHGQLGLANNTGHSDGFGY